MDMGPSQGKIDVYGYKVHVVIDSDSGLPVMLTITKAVDCSLIPYQKS